MREIASPTQKQPSIIKKILNNTKFWYFFIGVCWLIPLILIIIELRTEEPLTKMSLLPLIINVCVVFYNLGILMLFSEIRSITKLLYENFVQIKK